MLPGDPGGLTGSRCSSYETQSCLEKGGFEDPGKALRWWVDQLERARTFQKGYSGLSSTSERESKREREEIIKKSRREERMK